MDITFAYHPHLFPDRIFRPNGIMCDSLLKGPQYIVLDEFNHVLHPPQKYLPNTIM